METDNSKIQLLPKRDVIGKINFYRHYIRFMGIAALIGLAGVIYAFIMVDSVFLFLAVIVAVYLGINVLFALIWHKRFHNYAVTLDNDEIRYQVLYAALSEQMQSTEVRPKDRIPEEVLTVPDFPFNSHYGEYDGHDYASAYYGSTFVEVCHASFGNLRTVTDLPDQYRPRGETYQVRDDIFDGMYYVIHMKKKFYPLTIQKTGKKSKNRPGISTGDPSFDKIFDTYTEAPDFLASCLTPELRQFLLNVASRTKCNFYLHFSSDSNVYLAFNESIYIEKIKSGEQAFGKIDNELTTVIGLINGNGMMF